MTLKTGSRLGPYEIVALLGAAGMGEVYKARDTRLDRTVAIKVLPSHLSSNPDFRERFEREARAVSSLNHSHICTSFLQGAANETHSRFSPNGKVGCLCIGRIGPSGSVCAGISGGKISSLTNGGDQPIWRKDGKEPYYLATGGNMMAVEVRTDSEFESDQPKILFKTEILVTGNTTFCNGYLPSADGSLPNQLPPARLLLFYVRESFLSSFSFP